MAVVVVKSKPGEAKVSTSTHPVVLSSLTGVNSVVRALVG